MVPRHTAFHWLLLESRPRGGVSGSGSGCGSGPTLQSAAPFHHNRRCGCTATARRPASRLWPCLFLAIAAVRTHLFELIESALLGCVGARLLGCCPCTCLRSGQQLASEAQRVITQNAGELVKALKGEHPRPALHTPNSLSPLHAAARPCFKVAPSVFRHSRAVRLESCFGRCCVKWFGGAFNSMFCARYATMLLMLRVLLVRLCLALPRQTTSPPPTPRARLASRAPCQSSAAR